MFIKRPKNTVFAAKPPSCQSPAITCKSVTVSGGRWRVVAAVWQWGGKGCFVTKADICPTVAANFG